MADILTYVSVCRGDKSHVLALPRSCSAIDLRRLLATLFLTPEEAAAGAAPVGLLLADDKTVLPVSTACADTASLSHTVTLLVAGSAVEAAQPDAPQPAPSSSGISFLSSMIRALHSKAYIDARSAAVLQSALAAPSHRAEFQRLYDAYIGGDIDVTSLRDGLLAMSVRLDLPALPLQAQQMLAQYIVQIEVSGFFSSAESSMLRARVAAGDPLITEVYASALRLRDMAVLHRGLMDIVRGSMRASGGEGTDDDDDGDSYGSDNTSSADGSALRDPRDPRSGMRPSNPTPEADELMRVVEDMLANGDISRDDFRVLRELVTAENEYVMAAFDVYDKDEHRDEEELKDTLKRVARLHAVSASGRSSVTGDAGVEYPTTFLRQLVTMLSNMCSVNAGEAQRLNHAIDRRDSRLLQLYQTYMSGNRQDFTALHDGVVATVRAASAEDLIVAMSNLDPEWPSGQLAEDVSTAHASLTAEMRAHGKLSGGDVNALRRLFAARDNAVRAAWYTYTLTSDREALEDTLLSIVARESASASMQQDTMVVFVRSQVTAGNLSADEGERLEQLIRDGHEMVSAAFEAYSLDRDAEELLDTLKLTVSHMARTASPTVPPSLRTVLQVAVDLREGGTVSAAEAAALLKLVHNLDPRVMAARDVYAAEGQRADLADTLARIARLAAASPGFATKYADSSATDAAAGGSSSAFFPDTDATAAVIRGVMDESAATRAMVPELLALARDNDPTVMAAVEVYQITRDGADLADTLTRIARSARRPRSGAGAGQSSGVAPLTEAAKRAVAAAADTLNLSPADDQQLRRLVDGNHHHVVAAAEVYGVDGNLEELADTLARVLAQQSASGAMSPVTGSPGNVSRLLSHMVARGELTGDRFNAALRLHRSGDGRLAAALALPTRGEVVAAVTAAVDADA